MTRLGRWVRRLATEERRERVRTVLTRASRSYVVIVLLGVVIGLQVAPAVTQYASRPAAGSVAVVTLAGGIDGENAASVTERLREARRDPSVDAVVLRINSPGGSAAASEALYLAVKRTARRKPVVTSVDAMAASGAYYAAAPSDEIVVKPASLVGSVGVFLTTPAPVPPLDRLITTGPNKLTGADQREWYYKTESIRRAFVGAVQAGRGDRLELTAEQLSYAKLYTGAEAVENGLADRIGGLQTAIERAAALAGLPSWTVETLGYAGTVQFVTRANYAAASTDRKVLVSPQYFVAAPNASAGPAVVMLPPSVVRAALADSLDGAGRPTGVTANGTAAPE
ncbi:MAG: S49 family peptidase [Halobacteriales archaeon]